MARGQSALGGEHGINKEANSGIFQQDGGIADLCQFQTVSPPNENPAAGKCLFQRPDVL